MASPPPSIFIIRRLCIHCIYIVLDMISSCMLQISQLCLQLGENVVDCSLGFLDAHLRQPSVPCRAVVVVVVVVVLALKQEIGLVVGDAVCLVAMPMTVTVTVTVTMAMAVAVAVRLLLDGLLDLRVVPELLGELVVEDLWGYLSIKVQVLTWVRVPIGT